MMIKECNQLIDSIETYAYGTSKDLVSDKEETKCNKIIKTYNIQKFLIIRTEY